MTENGGCTSLASQATDMTTNACTHGGEQTELAGKAAAAFRHLAHQRTKTMLSMPSTISKIVQGQQ